MEPKNVSKHVHGEVDELSRVFRTLYGSFLT